MVYYDAMATTRRHGISHRSPASASSSPASPAWSPARWRPARAADNTVYGAARFADPDAARGARGHGITTIRVDLERGDLDEVPDDLDYVLHFAVAKTNDFGRDLAANADGAAHLMEKVQGVDAFFHCSSGGVYQEHEHDHLKEDAPLGDSHRAAGHGELLDLARSRPRRWCSTPPKRLGIPTVIARLSVPYGDTFGWPFFHVMMLEHGMAIPVHTDAPSQYNPLNLDDIVASLPYLLASASTPANVVNWGGDEIVSVEEWCGAHRRAHRQAGELRVHRRQRAAADPRRRQAQRPRLPLLGHAGRTASPASSRRHVPTSSPADRFSVARVRHGRQRR